MLAKVHTWYLQNSADDKKPPNIIFKYIFADPDDIIQNAQQNLSKFQDRRYHNQRKQITCLFHGAWEMWQ